ncbi:hypothetical protein OESDEN_18362, partial [Oesophagostomum dentatum]
QIRLPRSARDIPSKPNYDSSPSREEPKPSRLSGRLTVDRSNAESKREEPTRTRLPPSRTSRVAARGEAIRTYVPPAMRAAEKNDASKANAEVRNR